jgi:tetratricopeptide (TPR) repeat protein
MASATMALSIAPSGLPMWAPASPRPDTDCRMRLLISFALSCALMALSAGARADLYSDVNRLIQSGQLEKAQQQVDQRLKTAPTDPQMRLLLSRIQDAQGQTPAAMDTLQGLTQSFPELAEPHNNLAALLARKNRHADALISLQAAIKARPDYAIALENMGDVYAALASQSYGKALQITPNQRRIQAKQLTIDQMLKAAP